MNQGIVYIIGGKKFARWTLRSVISLRQNGGEAGNLPVHIHFLGDYHYEEQFNQMTCTCISHPRSDPNESFTCLHRRYRSFIMQEVPFDKFVMLDSDTFIQGDFIDFFKMTPNDGIGGAEDGKFESHLKIARDFFLKKNLSSEEARKETFRLLEVDYGGDCDFPVYYNCGSVCFSKSACKKIGAELIKVLERIQDDPAYNTHDDQLPFNSVVYRLGIKAESLNPKFNYTKSRMLKNKRLKLHDKVKNDVRIIHNRRCIESDWIEKDAVESVLKKLTEE